MDSRIDDAVTALDKYDHCKTCGCSFMDDGTYDVDPECLELTFVKGTYQCT